MKMIVVILQDDDAESVSEALIEAGMTVSRIASTGGFLRQGRSTLMVGVKKEKVDDVIKLIDDNCAPTIEPMQRKATLFVLNVEHFEQI